MGSIKRTLNGLFFNVEAFQLCHSLTAAETRQFDHPLVVFISKTKKGVGVNSLLLTSSRTMSDFIRFSNSPGLRNVKSSFFKTRVVP